VAHNGSIRISPPFQISPFSFPVDVLPELILISLIGSDPSQLGSDCVYILEDRGKRKTYIGGVAAGSIGDEISRNKLGISQRELKVDGCSSEIRLTLDGNLTKRIESSFVSKKLFSISLLSQCKED
jgi:hypothetical protein